LGGVEGVGVAARQAAAEQVDPVVVAAQERFERRGVAGLGGLDELLVGIHRHAGTLPLAGHDPRARISPISAAARPGASPRSTIHTSTAEPRAPPRSISLVPAGRPSVVATGSPQPARSPAGASAT